MSAEDQLFVPDEWVEEYQRQQQADDALRQADDIINQAEAASRFIKVFYGLKHLASRVIDHIPHGLPTNAPPCMSDHYLRPEERLPRFGPVPDVYTQQWSDD